MTRSKNIAKQSDPRPKSGRKPKVPYAMRNVTKMDITMLYAIVIASDKHMVSPRKLLLLFEMSMFTNGFTVRDLKKNDMFPQWMLNNFEHNVLASGWISKEKVNPTRNIYYVSEEGRKFIEEFQQTFRIQLIRFKKLINATRAGLWNNLPDTDITEATTLAKGARPKTRTKVCPDGDSKDI